MDSFGALAEITLDDGTVLKLTATDGTVSWFFFKAGDRVHVNAPLYTYYGEEGAGGFRALVQKRQKIEDQLAQLFQMYRDGCAVASGDGMVLELDETLVKNLAFEDGGGLQVVLLTNRDQTEPQPVLTTTYLSGTVTEGGTVSLDGEELPVGGLDTLGAKPGDTVVVQCMVYTMDGEPVPEPAPVYTAVFLIQPAKPADNSLAGLGGGFSIDFGGGGFSFGGGAAGGADGTAEQEATLAETKIASVVAMDEVQVTITVDELDILSLHKGDKALVTLDALPGRSFEGVVTAVSTGRSNSGGNSKYTAEVTLARSDDMLAGMNASCLVTVETFRDVLSIPAAALYDRADGSEVYTALSKDTGKPESPVPVEVGVSDGERVEILSGLAEGQTVWYTIYDTPEYSVPGTGGAAL